MSDQCRSDVRTAVTGRWQATWWAADFARSMERRACSKRSPQMPPHHTRRSSSWFRAEKHIRHRKRPRSPRRRCDVDVDDPAVRPVGGKDELLLLVSGPVGFEVAVGADGVRLELRLWRRRGPSGRRWRPRGSSPEGRHAHDDAGVDRPAAFQPSAVVQAFDLAGQVVHGLLGALPCLHRSLTATGLPSQSPSSDGPLGRRGLGYWTAGASATPYRQQFPPPSSLSPIFLPF
nr:hypothetical protein [Streptomyces sp.]